MKNAVPVFLGTMFLLSGSAAHADDALPSVATIRANVAAALGASPTAYHKTLEFTSSDGTTTVENDTRRGNAYRDVRDMGPFHTENGSADGQAWYQDDNGQIVLDQPDPGFAARETLRTTVTRVHAPLDAYVLARLDANGYGMKEYVDATTWRVMRRETIAVNGIVATSYDDVRQDHGVTFPHRWHTEDGIDRTTTDARITAYDIGPVGDAEVAIPKPRRALVDFPEGGTAVTLPTVFGRSRVYVRVTIKGRGLDFLLDTGSAGITIDSTTAKQLDLPIYAQRSGVTAGRYTTARSIVPEMRVGPLAMKDVAVQIVPQGWEENGGTVKVVGLLGFDFLAELGLTIDYEHQRVTVVPSADYTPPSDPAVIPLDVRIGGGQPLATVKINDALGERWVLDTGAADTFLIFDYFARRHPEALRDQRAVRGLAQKRFGIGGSFETEPYRIGKLQLGSVIFRDFVGDRVTSKGAYAEDSDGLIGTQFLRLFTVALDYGNSRVYLNPNAEGRGLMGR